MTCHDGFTLNDLVTYHDKQNLANGEQNRDGWSENISFNCGHEGPTQVPPLPGSDIFEPGDLEFYLLGRLEGRRSYDYRTGVRTDIPRMARYRHCDDVFINGPHGYSFGSP